MSKGSENAFPMKGMGLTFSEMQGLTKRELFAAMIAQGIATRGPIEGEADPSIEGRCRHAVRVADALIAALEGES